MNNKELNILERSFLLFQKYGIKSVTMDDICSEIGISKKTVYQYFSDKAALVKKIIENEFCRISESIDRIMNDNINAIEQLIALNQFLNSEHKAYKPAMVFDLRKYFPEIYYSIKKKKRDHTLKAILSNLKKGKKEGLYRLEMDDQIIAKLYVFRIENIMENDIFSFEEMTSEKFVNEIFNFHIHGIINEKGIKFLKHI
ncbi:MAG: TetR/AcrR family transcriptional regulator [Bacteroidetes bacterium]|nr:TetR/AcrR family transcriptional regulator [Bacteroidota bacterium]